MKGTFVVSDEPTIPAPGLELQPGSGHSCAVMSWASFEVLDGVDGQALISQLRWTAPLISKPPIGPL